MTSLMDDPAVFVLKKSGAKKSKKIIVVHFFPESGIVRIETEVTKLIESRLKKTLSNP
jgi:hypothetical protein